MPEVVIQRVNSLTQQVYRYLKDAILTGQIGAGERVVESRLAGELKVSRSPIREAMRLLVAEQILVERDGAIHVVQPTFEDLRELYELRLALETTMAKSAAARMSTETLTQLEANLERTASVLDAGRTEELPDVNEAFHGLIWAAAGNQRILGILSNVAALINYYCYLVFKINRLKTNILSEHQAIYEVLKEQDGTLAYERMYTHIARDLTHIEQGLQHGGDVSR